MNYWSFKLAILQSPSTACVQILPMSGIENLMSAFERRKVFFFGKKYLALKKTEIRSGPLKNKF